MSNRVDVAVITEHITDRGALIAPLRAARAALETTQQPIRSNTRAAAMHIVCDRDGGDLSRTRRQGVARFEHMVRREIVKRGGQRPCGRIVSNLFAALADPAGVRDQHTTGSAEPKQRPNWQTSAVPVVLWAARGS